MGRSDRVVCKHWFDNNGRPSGGQSFGPGFAISWQRGPLVVADARQPQNGAWVEDVIYAAQDRLMAYQSTEFACDANQEAITLLGKALQVLEDRTKDRESRGVEGTHEK